MQVSCLTASRENVTIIVTWGTAGSTDAQIILKTVKGGHFLVLHIMIKNFGKIESADIALRDLVVFVGIP